MNIPDDIKNWTISRRAAFGADMDMESAPGVRMAGAIAEALGIGRRSVNRAITVKRASPELFEKVKNGELTVSGAERELRRQPPPDIKTYRITGWQSEARAKAENHRLDMALGNIEGAMMGLNELDVTKIWVSRTPEQIREIHQRFSQLSRELRGFARKLITGEQINEHNVETESQQTTGV